MSHYRSAKGSTALGTEHKFHGPGLSQYANGVHFLQIPCEWALDCMAKDKEREHGDHEAETIVRLLNEAYEAGRKSMKADFRQMLGLER